MLVGAKRVQRSKTCRYVVDYGVGSLVFLQTPLAQSYGSSAGKGLKREVPLKVRSQWKYRQRRCDFLNKDVTERQRRVRLTSSKHTCTLSFYNLYMRIIGRHWLKVVRGPSAQVTWIQGGHMTVFGDG
nr:hypothetical protein [Tanacetum cinerariifolium]